MISSVITTGLLGFLGGIVVAFLGYLVQNRKASIDESGQVFAQWKELLEAHKLQIRGLAERVGMLEKDNQSLRQRVSHLERELSSEKRQREAVEDENTGLKRQLAQMSEGGVVTLGDIPPDNNRATFHAVEVAKKRQRDKKGSDK